MKEKFVNVKEKGIGLAKKAWEWMRANGLVVGTVMFSVVAFILILIAMFVLQEFVVSVCILLIIEAAMAALLHQAEIWKHGVLLGLQLVAGIIIGRIALVIICMIAYVAATFALQLMGKKNEETELSSENVGTDK